ncbi:MULTISPECIES: hypothetical protein [Aquimarina]|uniref:hypothetical protein n=1 Tax=Aquimarina TaxID=290174 RepID=UPI000CDE7775|nr:MULTISPECIES: hypothetical protein [Aquimarina]
MKQLKTVLAFFLIIIFTGCLDDDNETTFFYELTPIEKVDIPDEFTRGETVKITTTYIRPSNCHAFYDYRYSIVGNERTVTAINVYIDEGNCTEKTELVSESFNFLVGEEDSYIFRFWQGRDENDDNQFLTIEVPVL